MKLKIIKSQEEMTPGYQCISPDQLNGIPNGTCDEVWLCHILDFIPNREQILPAIIQKLKTGGVLTIEGTDIVVISRMLFSGELSIDVCNKILYGGRQSIDTIQRLLLTLQQTYHMEILEKQLLNFQYYIRAVRRLAND